MLPSSEIVPLSQAHSAVALRVVSLAASPDAHYLREMGFCEGCELRIVCRADPMICLVRRVRLAIARRLAESVLVCRAAHALARP